MLCAITIIVAMTSLIYYEYIYRGTLIWILCLCDCCLIYIGKKLSVCASEVPRTLSIPDSNMLICFWNTESLNCPRRYPNFNFYDKGSLSVWERFFMSVQSHFPPPCQTSFSFQR